MRGLRRGPRQGGSQQGGFTLIELMVVVFIVGAIMAAAVPLVTADPSIDEVSRKVMAKLRETARFGASRGPLREDVQANTFLNNRSRLLVDIAANGDSTLAVDVAIEDDLPGNNFQWQEISRMKVPRSVTIVGFSNVAELNGGAAPTTALGPGDRLEIQCAPSGVCQAVTLYLQEGTNPNKRARVVLIPLGGTPIVFGGW